MKAQRPFPKPKTKAQLFLGDLPTSQHHVLKVVARALHRATREQQAELLQRLQLGHIAASAKVAGAGTLLDLPHSLWEDIRVADFDVRYYQNGHWTVSDYHLPTTLVIKHSIVPMLQRAAAAVPDEPDVADEGESTKSEILRAISLLEAQRQEVEVVVTASNARLFAENFLGGAVTVERRGRRKTPGIEELYAEICQRLWNQHMGKLPKQEAFAAALLDWWNSDPNRAPMKHSWAMSHVKVVWAAIKQNPSIRT